MGGYTRPVSEQRLDKGRPTLDKTYKEGQSLELSSEAGYSPDSNDVSTEAEESSLLRPVTRKRLVKADWEDLACALVICKVCSLASRVSKWPTNRVTNANPLYRHLHVTVLYAHQNIGTHRTDTYTERKDCPLFRAPLHNLYSCSVLTHDSLLVWIPEILYFISLLHTHRHIYVCKG
jgi:hypothetical protein